MRAIASHETRERLVGSSIRVVARWKRKKMLTDDSMFVYRSMERSDPRHGSLGFLPKKRCRRGKGKGASPGSIAEEPLPR